MKAASPRDTLMAERGIPLFVVITDREARRGSVCSLVRDEFNRSRITVIAHCVTL